MDYIIFPDVKTYVRTSEFLTARFFSETKFNFWGDLETAKIGKNGVVYMPIKTGVYFSVKNRKISFDSIVARLVERGLVKTRSKP